MKLLKKLFSNNKSTKTVQSALLSIAERTKKTTTKEGKPEKLNRFEYAADLIDKDDIGHFVEPEESYDLEIVGESFYQKELDRLAGPRTKNGVTFECDAILICDSQNKHDSNAIRIVIGESTVGYLSKSDAIQWRKMLGSIGASNQSVRAKAMIVGGWLADEKKGKEQGSYGVKLDIPVDF